jgi:hypothetical protein
MFDEILVCLDGSPVRVVGDSNELSVEENYMRERARLFRAPIRFVVSSDPATSILGELEKNPRAIAAMTTHGRSAWGEALLGSVALKVIRGREAALVRALVPASKKWF